MKCVRSLTAALAAALLSSRGTAAADFSVDSEDSIRKTASTIAYDLVKYYHGNETGETPGILDGPPPAGDFYWGDAGAFWVTLIEYWHYTGDSSYNDLAKQALLFQKGGNWSNFLPLNYTASMSNDDQGFWASAAMSAAESSFPGPDGGELKWVDLVDSVFNQFVSLWDSETCGGGMRWWKYSFNHGYNYKTSVATGFLFTLGARLARYTGNQTYADWADKAWTWMQDVELIDPDTYSIYDGAHTDEDCGDVNKATFSLNNGIFTYGAAVMYNFTDGNSTWGDRVDKLVDAGISDFFPDNIAYEEPCEGIERCSNSMKYYKGLLAQWYAAATEAAPQTADKIMPVLKDSAAAAVKTCTGGDSDRACGFAWADGDFDGEDGASAQMSVLNTVSGLLVGSAKTETSKSGEHGTDKEGEGEDGKDQDGDESEDSAAVKFGGSMLSVAVAFFFSFSF